MELERLEFAGGEESCRQSLKFIVERRRVYCRPMSWNAPSWKRILALAIDRIPKTERTVLQLYYYEELNLREIGEIVGMHLSRVAQLRTQGILRLRSHLERVWLSQPRRKG